MAKKIEIVRLSEAELLAQAKLVAHHRAADPSSRVVGLIKHSGGGTRKSYVCVWCGERSDTYSGKHAEPKSIQKWYVDHVREHVADVEAELVAFDARMSKR